LCLQEHGGWMGQAQLLGCLCDAAPAQAAAAASSLHTQLVRAVLSYLCNGHTIQLHAGAAASPPAAVTATWQLQRLVNESSGEQLRLLPVSHEQQQQGGTAGNGDAMEVEQPLKHPQQQQQSAQRSKPQLLVLPPDGVHKPAAAGPASSPIKGKRSVRTPSKAQRQGPEAVSLLLQPPQQQQQPGQAATAAGEAVVGGGPHPQQQNVTGDAEPAEDLQQHAQQHAQQHHPSSTEQQQKQFAHPTTPMEVSPPQLAPAAEAGLAAADGDGGGTTADTALAEQAAAADVAGEQPAPGAPADTAVEAAQGLQCCEQQAGDTGPAAAAAPTPSQIEAGVAAPANADAAEQQQPQQQDAQQKEGDAAASQQAAAAPSERHMQPADGSGGRALHEAPQQQHAAAQAGVGMQAAAASAATAEDVAAPDTSPLAEPAVAASEPPPPAAAAAAAAAQPAPHSKPQGKAPPVLPACNRDEAAAGASAGVVDPQLPAAPAGTPTRRRDSDYSWLQFVPRRETRGQQSPLRGAAASSSPLAAADATAAAVDAARSPLLCSSTGKRQQQQLKLGSSEPAATQQQPHAAAEQPQEPSGPPAEAAATTCDAGDAAAAAAAPQGTGTAGSSRQRGKPASTATAQQEQQQQQHVPQRRLRGSSHDGSAGPAEQQQQVPPRRARTSSHDGFAAATKQQQQLAAAPRRLRHSSHDGGSSVPSPAAPAGRTAAAAAAAAPGCVDAVVANVASELHANKPPPACEASQLVGRRIRVFWPDDQQWFAGTITVSAGGLGGS
jgi:hypothetical protein